jgi:hypothetical protein
MKDIRFIWGLPQEDSFMKLRNGLIGVVDISVCGRRSLDRYVVDVRDGDMRDFCL